MGIDALIESQVLKLAAKTQQPFGLRRLRAEFIQIEKFAQRFIAVKPRLLVKNIGVDRRGSQLQIHARVFAQRGIVNQLRQRMQIIGRLRRDDDA